MRLKFLIAIIMSIVVFSPVVLFSIATFIISSILGLSDEIVDIAHKGHESMTELSYQAAWARTYLRIYGIMRVEYSYLRM